MKILYITANPKPEEQSSSKSVARYFINECIENRSDAIIEEMNLFEEDIPEVDFQLYSARSSLKQGEEYDALGDDLKQKIDRLNFLCEQFLSADRYVIAAPMWSLMFPGKLKNYIDAVVQNHKVIEIKEDCVHGLLDDKIRRMIYIQSSCGKYSNIITSRFDYGTDYLDMIFKFLGIKTFLYLPVEGTGQKNCCVASAIIKANQETKDLIHEFLC